MAGHWLFGIPVDARLILWRAVKGWPCMARRSLPELQDELASLTATFPELARAASAKAASSVPLRGEPAPALDERATPEGRGG